MSVNLVSHLKGIPQNFLPIAVSTSISRKIASDYNKWPYTRLNWCAKV